MVTFKFRNATIKGSGKYLLAAVWPQRWQLGAANEGKSSKKKKSIQMLLDSPKCASSPLGRTQYVRRAAPFHGAPPVLFPAHHALPARIGSPTPRARVHTGPPMRTWPRTSYEQRELLPSLRSGTRRRAPAAQLLRSHMSRSHSHHGADVALPVPPPTPSVGHLTPAHVLPGPPFVVSPVHGRRAHTMPLGFAHRWAQDAGARCGRFTRGGAVHLANTSPAKSRPPIKRSRPPPTLILLASSLSPFPPSPRGGLADRDRPRILAGGRPPVDRP
jgi:hypothetical protein